MRNDYIRSCVVHSIKSMLYRICHMVSFNVLCVIAGLVFVSDCYGRFDLNY
jgi:hypothetical protein